MSFIQDIVCKKKMRIAFLVDGPNILRKAFSVDLVAVRKEVQKYGDVRIAKIFLDQYASDKLIEAMVNQGFETVITTGDVDVTLAIDGAEYVFDPKIDMIVLMTRDTDFRPLLVKARANGKKTMIIGVDFAFSAALRNTADKVLTFKGNGALETVTNDPNEL